MATGVNDIQVPSMPAEELKRRLTLSQAPILLDVREFEELYGPIGHLPRVLHVPVASISGRLPELQAHRDEEIVTVCRSGGRAMTGAKILLQEGFKQV